MSRTNIDIDDELMAETMRVTGKATKKGAVEEAMRQIVREARQRLALERLWGIGWEGNLEAMRQWNEMSGDGANYDEKK